MIWRKFLYSKLEQRTGCMNQNKLQCGYHLLHFPLSVGHILFFYRLSCIFSVNALSSSIHMIADVRITGALFLLFGHLSPRCLSYLLLSIHCWWSFSLLFWWSFFFLSHQVYGLCLCGCRILLLNSLLFFPLTFFCPVCTSLFLYCCMRFLEVLPLHIKYFYFLENPP